jgi:hypothetical protein
MTIETRKKKTLNSSVQEVIKDKKRKRFTMMFDTKSSAVLILFMRGEDILFKSKPDPERSPISTITLNTPIHGKGRFQVKRIIRR